MNNTFLTVHTIEDYYDGPRSGVADLDGTPHFYRSIYLDTVDWNPDEDRFEVSPISETVLTAACEAAAIFARWDKIRQVTQGFTYSDEEFGALPEDRGRYRELKRFLKSSYAAAAKASRILVRGEFRQCENSPSRLQVRWKVADQTRPESRI